MTEEQIKTVEALALNNGGFVSVRQVQFATTGDDKAWLIEPNGDATEIDQRSMLKFRAMQRQVYGAEATA